MGSRNYCFTSYLIEECTSMLNWEHRKYITWGLEKCPTTGREHFQGYIELLKPQRITALKKIAATTHFEERKGTQEEAIKYCHKDGQFIEEGIKAKGQGHRTDLEELKLDLDKGMNLKEISDEHFECFLRYNKSIKEYQLLHQTHRSWKTDLIILFGEPGTGKSHLGFSKYPEAYPMLQPTNGGVYFDGYIGQETVIIDDFYGWIQFSLLLKMTDKYPLIVHTKGGSVQFKPKRIIITSNSNPLDWYNSKDIDISALTRRITCCWYYQKDKPIIELTSTEDLEKTGRRQAPLPLHKFALPFDGFLPNHSSA